MRIGITMPTRTAPLERIPEYARLADEAGFASIWSYELYRNPFTLLALAATTSRRATLATGLTGAFPRSPFECANGAADVDELTGGRMLLGLGTGVPEFLEAFHSTDARQMVGRMREYIDVLRLSWQYLAHGEAASFEGEHYRFVPPPLNPWGVRAGGRDRIPIYLAAMRPKLLALTGEKADGWIGYLATPRFLERQVIPAIAAGAEAAGRDPGEVELAAEIICCVSPDRDVALRRARIHVGFYVAHPVSDVVAAEHGLEADVAAVRQALMTEGFAGLEKTSDRLVEAFSIAGTPEEARQQVDQYGALTHLALHTPYIPPLDAAESDDAYRQIVAAFGDLAAASSGTLEASGSR
jgi:alkanesulfonate monooxygenase SsuD/methylene tetrahydromethanopterin reductase-like flavin-dependent oxidoreductase (luciferase family)